jgi:two-component system chemotaxis sensor kinase CheA
MAMMTVRFASINAALLDTFREETAEGLDQLEARLLELVAGRDPDLIDRLFRIAHTIKGGAGTFGMTQMTRIAHRMESVLDTYRSGARPTREAVSILLEASDALRRLLAGGASAPDQDLVLEARLQQAAQAAPAAAPPEPAASIAPVQQPPPVARAPIARHQIRVAPSIDLFRLGIDPVLLFDQLTTLGELTAAVDASAVPPFDELDPMSCHLSWTLSLAGSDPDMIRALFGWIEDVCPIEVSSPGGAESVSAPPAPARPNPPPPDPLRAGSTWDAAPPRPASPVARDAGVAATIRVRLDKLDALMALVGDLLVTQSALCTLERGAGTGDRRRQSALDDLQRVTRALQQNALQLRSMPIGAVLDRFPRLVHDLAGRLGKEITIEIGGDGIELDKTVLERIGDPLVHLLRNSVDHGIELPEVREAAGKPRVGRIQIGVEQRGDEVLIEIVDDGRGLDGERIVRRAIERGLVAPDRTLSQDEIHRLIFLPGFSTADQVSEVSGRGVGMDVVVRTIEELGGAVQIRSQLGAGTTIVLGLPVTLAIIEGQIVQFGGRAWIVPLSHIVECAQLDPGAITTLPGKRVVYHLGDDVVPVIDLCQRMALPRSGAGKLVLFVEAGGQHRALLIDEIGARQQVVVKSLTSQIAPVDHLAGATVLGDGSVSFILDIVELCSNGADRPARSGM